MANRFSIEGRLGNVGVRGTRLTGEISEVVTSATLSMTTTEVTQLTLNVVDNELKLLDSGLFTAGTTYTPGTPMSYGGLSLECRAIEVGPRGTDAALTITARSRGAQALKRGRGVKLWRNLSPTHFAALAAKAAGLKFVGQGTGKRKTIRRDKDETTWDTLQRLAAESGFYCFEAAGTLYFAAPTWLTKAGRRELPVPWRGKGTADDLEELPVCRRSGDDPKRAATVSAKLRGDLGENALPGHGFRLWGVPTFEGLYIVDGVTINLAEGTPVQVSASTRIDPEKQPRQAAPGKKKRATSGSSGGSGGGGGGRRWPANTRALSGNYAGHSGVDIAAGAGSPIMAASAGKVEYVGWGRGFGQAIFVRGSDGLLQVYGHSSKLLTKAGEKVSPGDVIGLVGATGNATGPHLHFEIAKAPAGSVSNRAVTLAWLKSAA